MPPLTPDGFLLHAEFFGRPLSDGVSTQELAETRCLVLLGEAGAGKSTELALLRSASAMPTIHLDLGAYCSDESFRRDLRDRAASIENNSVEVSWDSLDEALLDTPRLLGVLQRSLEELRHLQVRLRVACRTAAWPESLTSILHGVFGSEDVEIYELAPLCRQDVALAAEDMGIDDDAFLDQVEQRAVGSFAANPTTLRMLLGNFSMDGALPSGMCELYERGLLKLCSRPPLRRDRSDPTLPAARILDLASRMAAVFLLTRRTAVFRGSEADASAGDLAEETLVTHGREHENEEAAITASDIRVVLTEAGLFSSRGESRVGFVHKTYAEFLAARFLHRSAIPWPQLKALLFVGENGQDRVIPPLRETAAWLASFDHEFFQRLLQSEPEVLLFSDVGMQSPQDRAELVERLVERMQAEEIPHEEVWGFRGAYHRLLHPGLADQVRRILTTPGIQDRTRLAVLDIASTCRLRELAHEIAEMALDASLHYQVRCRAAYAVRALEVPGAVQELRPLITSSPADDPDETLKGCALQALWPAHLSTSELCSALTTPRHPLFFGAYQGFLGDARLVGSIPTEDLLIALSWAASLDSLGDPTDSLSAVAGRLATRALLHLDQPETLRGLGVLVYERLKAGCRPVFVPIETNRRAHITEDEGHPVVLTDLQRKMLLKSIVESVDSVTSCSALFTDETVLFREGDLEWLLENACSTEGELSRRWAWLFKRFFWYGHITSCHLDLWLTGAESCPALAEIMPLPRPVELGSSEARAMQADHEEQLRWRQRHDQAQQGRAQSVEEIIGRIPNLLELCLEDPRTWFDTLLQYLRIATHPREIERLPRSIQDYPGWRRADPPMRAQILEAASRYLRDGLIEPSRLYDSNDRTLSDQAPALAAGLLIVDAPEKLEELPPERWNQIAPFIVFCPVGDPDQRRSLLQTAREQAGLTCREAALRVLELPRTDHLMVPILETFENPWDIAFEEGVMAFLGRAACPPERFRFVLAWLLRRGNVAAIHLAMDFVVPAPHFASVDPAYRVAAAASLLEEVPQTAWGIVGSIFQTDSGFGRAVVMQLDRRHADEGPRIADRLSDDALGEIVTWMVREFPPSSDPTFLGAHGMGPEDEARWWRGELLTALRDRGTVRACEFLDQLETDHPECPWLRDFALTARRALRSNSWNPPSPAQFFGLIRDGRRRYVENPAQLLDLLMESLERYEQALHGTTPAVATLWDRAPNRTWRPKEEDHLSDDIARHLRRDLQERSLVVNREVEIRRLNMAGTGQSTDIHVEALRRGSGGAHGDIARVVIEVKGCWHQEVRTAMRTQLADRYLAENQCHHGLYVVGWFLCAAWDDGDYRKRGVPWTSIEVARHFLGDQADELRSSRSEGDVRPVVLDCSLR